MFLQVCMLFSRSSSSPLGFSVRTWFKRSLDYAPNRDPKAKHRAGEGWDWLSKFHTKLDRIKTSSKLIANKTGYTVGSLHADAEKERQRIWKSQQHNESAT